MPHGNARSNVKNMLTTLAAGALCVMLCGCATLSYYGQAITGQWELMQRRVPLDEVIEAADTAPELKRKLILVASAREFATHELYLPDNGSYRSYADLERDYVVWNVFAAPELSLEPVSSCFLFVGCLSYRGYFNEERARRFGASLNAAGNDVFVGGVAAYSTLGWFDDPVLNTMLVWDDTRIVEVIFHELAHQLIYAEDDTVFNESFATALARAGVERWLAQEGRANQQTADSDERKNQFFELLLAYRAKLDVVYSGTANDDLKRSAKKRLFDELLIRYRELKQTWNNYDGYDDWMAEDLNNAKLASIATYHDYVPAFRSILETVDNDLNRFYASVESLLSWSIAQRKQCLGAWNGEAACLDGIFDSE
jgi:predicted aminopeptidase